MQVLAASSEVSRIQLQREQVTLICEVPEQSRCASSNLWWQKHQGTFLSPSLSPHSNCIKEIQLEPGQGGEGSPRPPLRPCSRELLLWEHQARSLGASTISSVPGACSSENKKKRDLSRVSLTVG